MTTEAGPREVFLARLRDDLEVAARRRRRRRRKALIATAATGVAALLVGGALAAGRAVLWAGRDLSPADVERQATTVRNDISGGAGKTGTHVEVEILPAMGITFVLPDGAPLSIVPAGGVYPDPSLVPATFAPVNGGGRWTVRLRGGGRRTIVWRTADGSVTVTDRRDGSTASTALHGGDVVPLVPGSLDRNARTLEKAVTFDLPTGNRVIIFPTFNETYINGVDMPPMKQPLPRGTAAKFGLAPIGDYDGRLPVTPDGGNWEVELPDGTRRTISWQAGNDYVTVEDTAREGRRQRTIVAVGHELPLVPFR